MLRRTFWINVGLFIIILLLGINVYKLWRSIFNEEWKGPISVLAKNITEGEVKFEDGADDVPALYTYDVIADKDLFRPERTEWIPPPPEPEETDKKETIPQYPSERHQPAMKEPTLYGIMIQGDKKSALMKGMIREEPKQRFRKVRLGNGEVREVPLPPIPGRVTEDKVRTYVIGDQICESTVVDIAPDRVILSKNGEEYELLLREPSRLAEKNVPTPGQEQFRQRGQEDNKERLPFGQPPSEEFSNLPHSPAYPPPPGFPVYQPPPGGIGQPRFGYPAFPPGGRGGAQVPPGRPPVGVFSGQMPGYPPQRVPFPPGGQGNPFFRPLPGGS
ncbi:MAG: hypothetical protein ACMUIA_05475 [bacterium]